MKLTQVIFICSVLVSLSVHSETILPTQLPNPLTLKYALSLASNTSHSEVQLALSEQLQTQYEQNLFESKHDFQVGIYGQLAAVKPSSLLSRNFSDRNTDHELSLYLTKRLYDFGRRSNQLDASEKKLQAASSQLINKKKSQYLKILKSYFDVILSDLEFLYHNEAMAIAYIQFDRAQTNFGLKKLSELELLRIKTDYEKTNIERVKSQNNQRIKRLILAISLDQPDQLPSELQVPDLSIIPSFSNNRDLPDIEQLQITALNNNLQLKIITYQIEAEQKQQQAYNANKYPIISGKLETAWYSRELGGDDKAVAALSIDIPLYQGNEVQSQVGISSAKLSKLKAIYKSKSIQLRQQVLEIWMNLQNLKQQYLQVKTELDYRELYLDKSRVEYESELKSDLGSAMVDLSATQLLEKQVLFEIAYQWAQLDIIMDNKQLYAYTN